MKRVTAILTAVVLLAVMLAVPITAGASYLLPEDVAVNARSALLMYVGSDPTQDAVLFGINPDKMEVANAVRMSMSIPLFYRPVVLKDIKGKAHYIADGGLLSNYPVYLIDRYMDSPQIPTFGFKFINPQGLYIKSQNTIDNIIEYCKFTLETMLSAQDNMHVSKSSGDFERTVFTSVNIVEDGKIKTLNAANFDITPKESQAMFENGVIAAKKFLDGWDFTRWKEKYRNHKRSLTKFQL